MAAKLDINGIKTVSFWYVRGQWNITNRAVPKLNWVMPELIKLWPVISLEVLRLRLLYLSPLKHSCRLLHWRLILMKMEPIWGQSIIGPAPQAGVRKEQAVPAQAGRPQQDLAALISSFRLVHGCHQEQRIARHQARLSWPVFSNNNSSIRSTFYLWFDQIFRFWNE